MNIDLRRVYFSGKVAEWSKAAVSKSVVGVPYRGFESHPFRHFPGEVTEWSKVHDWKSCVSKGTAGSNPALSAILPVPVRRYGLDCFWGPLFEAVAGLRRKNVRRLAGFVQAVA